MDGAPRRDATALAAAAAGSFMSTFSTGLVSVATPEIQADFGVSVAQAGWVFTSYLLAASTVLLVCGRWGDLVGFDKVLALGLLGFAGTSVLCACSWQFWILITGRLLQGAFAGMLSAASPALITTTLAPERRARGLGVLGICTYVGLGAGPLAGGVLTGWLGWRSVFGLTLAVAAVPLGLVYALPERAERVRRTPFEGLAFDVPSLLLWCFGISGVITAVGDRESFGQESSAGSTAWWLFAAGAVALTAFAWRQTRLERPLIPLALLRTPEFRNGTASAFLLYVASFLTLFVLPFQLRDEWHFEPARIGLLMAIPPVLMAVAAPLGSATTHRWGARGPSTGGLLLLAVAAVVVARSGGWASTLLLALGLGGIGGGHGMFATANSIAVLGSAGPEQQGAAAGMLAVARSIGMTCGVASGGALASWLRAWRPAGPRVALSHTLVAGSLIALMAAGLTWSMSPAGRRASAPRF